MATTHPRGRDHRYTKTIEQASFVGRRYVENGKVRVEWKESGKRRRRTIGSNTAETRRRADAILKEILASMQDHEERHEQEPQGQEPSDQETTPSQRPLGETLRDYALAAIGVADGIADWVRDAITRPPEWEWVEAEDAEQEGEDEEPSGEKDAD